MTLSEQTEGVEFKVDMGWDSTGLLFIVEEMPNRRRQLLLLLHSETIGMTSSSTCNRVNEHFIWSVHQKLPSNTVCNKYVFMYI